MPHTIVMTGASRGIERAAAEHILRDAPDTHLVFVGRDTSGHRISVSPGGGTVSYCTADLSWVTGTLCPLLSSLPGGPRGTASTGPVAAEDRGRSGDESTKQHTRHRSRADRVTAQFGTATAPNGNRPSRPSLEAALPDHVRA